MLAFLLTGRSSRRAVRENRKHVFRQSFAGWPNGTSTCGCWHFRTKQRIGQKSRSYPASRLWDELCHNEKACVRMRKIQERLLCERFGDVGGSRALFFPG